MEEREAGPIESRSTQRGVDERILLLAPTGDDAALASGILQDRGLAVVTVKDLPELAFELEAGAGVALIAAEAFEGKASEGVLLEVLERQAPWSEMPILLFGGSVEDAAAHVMERFGARAQIILLERPLGVATFITATESALRSRHRQYQVKRLLEELGDSAVKIAQAHAEANHAKDEFIATLAHELRSPMTAIHGWIQLLKTGTLDAAGGETALSMIESSTKVQAHIIEDLMDVSRIVAGKVMIEPALVDLVPLVRSVVATFSPSAVSNGIELSSQLPEVPLIALVDDARLQQVGWNLVSNAIKFTPRGGAVRVSLARETDSAVIRVRDTGKGLSSDLLAHVFERYRQADRGTKKSYGGGLGLGLAIVRHLVEGHGGTVEAFSAGAGQGAEFVVTLPLPSPNPTPNLKIESQKPVPGPGKTSPD